MFFFLLTRNPLTDTSWSGGSLSCELSDPLSSVVSFFPHLFCSNKNARDSALLQGAKSGRI